MDYTCPNPQCKSNWTLGESFYLGGTPFDCGSCKKVTTIPLYCPHCYPRTMQKKRYLETPRGFLGGETYTCGNCHKPFTVPVMNSEVYSRLQSWGTELGQYRQSERIDALPHEGLKNTVSGGYCAGVVYDWIRRLLLGGKTTYKDDKPMTDVRVAVAWTQQTSQKKNAYLQTKGDQLNQARDRQIELAEETYNRETQALTQKINQAYNTLNQNTRLTNQERRELANKLRAAYDNKIRELSQTHDATVNNVNTKVNAWFDKSSMEAFWPEFSRVMDAYLTKDRLRRGKEGDSARQFSDLKVAKSVNSASFNGLQLFIDTLLRDGEFVTNRAAYVSINPPIQGAVGHAVGIFRQNTGNYYLFDPNFGVYELGAAQLKESFVYIFKKAYPNMGAGGTSDNHAYEINGKVLGGYSIFEGAHPPVPSVTPTPTISRQPPKPQELAPMNTPPKFEPFIPTRPIPKLEQKPVTNGPSNTPGGTTGTNPQTPQPPRTRGNVASLIDRFNK